MDIKFNTLGSYEKIKKTMKITLFDDYNKALLKLDHFSHCIIFTKDEEQIYSTSSEIKHIDIDNSEIVLDIENLKGDLVDIKPYFPVEENLKEEVNKTEFLFAFKEEVIGDYIYFNNSGVIKFDSNSNLSSISEGDYVRVLWWFHRFDKKEFRRTRTCNPPYENAPKTGVFASRSPVRPNPLASTVVKVTKVDEHNNYISVEGFDGFPYSNVVQVMPYNSHERFQKVKVPSWVENWSDHKVFNKEKGNIINEEIIISDVYLSELEDYDIDLEHVNSDEIFIKNASINNLKNISVSIPKRKITAITGVSGSGKSSLAFDTIYHESKKQFIDLIASNSPLGGDLDDSKVEKISGLQPSIAVEQRSLGNNPRSTVGSVTKASDFLKLLYSTIGIRICPICHIEVKDQVCKTCDTVYFPVTPSHFGYNNPEFMCPVCKGLGQELVIDEKLVVENPDKSILDSASSWWGDLRKHKKKPSANWMRGEVLALAIDLDEDLEVPFKDLSDTFKKEVFHGTKREVSLSFKNSSGRQGTITRPVEGAINTINRLLKDSKDKSTAHLDKFIVKSKCRKCDGERLKDEGRLVKVNKTRYPEAVKMSISKLKAWCHTTYDLLEEDDKTKTKEIFKKLLFRLNKIESVGLNYISLDRSVPSLSGGESQRIKIATQFGSGLTNILYIMDEPSRGLHPKDYHFLIKTIKDLKKLDNTVIIVEHKKSFVKTSDHPIEMGPRAGKYGGEILLEKDLDNSDFKLVEEIYNTRGNKTEREIVLVGARTNNLKDITVNIPLGKLTCVVGVSGSGKSSLISKTLLPAIKKELNKKIENDGSYDLIKGVKQLKEVYFVSQKSIGKTPRSNPATYTGVFDYIRDFYSKLEESKTSKLTKEHFSFNSKKGQCSECKGAGLITIPMHFMKDIYTKCSKCSGKRYKDNVLEIKYKGYSISDILELEISEAIEVFKDEEKIYSVLNMLDKVGVSYLKLGQSATTLSGGEAQRIKLAKELSLGKTKDVLYILDEPTTGLHHDDTKKLISVLKELTSSGASVIVIEHNDELIKESDWLIEMGPSGGDEGGYVSQIGWLEK